MQVEDPLIALKRVWPPAVEGAGVPRADSSRLLARFVTMRVEKHYAPLG